MNNLGRESAEFARAVPRSYREKDANTGESCRSATPWRERNYPTPMFSHVFFSMPRLAGPACAAFLLTATLCRGLEVREAIWGYDGRVLPEHFNVLSVLVSNPSDRPFEGTLRLAKEHGLGAAYAQPCYVSPSGTRWVQFYPYVNGNSSPWILGWGRRPGENMRLNPPDFGPPARVFLYDADSPRAPPAGFRSFPDALFPSTAAAADALDSVVLDYAPRWAAVKRAAFRDWLRRGGIVHVLKDAEGRYPAFDNELAVLNVAPGQTRVGRGLVVRQARARSEVTADMLTATGFAAPRLAENPNTTVWDLGSAILPALGRLAQPRHRWWLIDTMAVVYILAIGPGVFLLGKRTRDYRLRLLLLAGVIAVFSALFGFVGRRGQGETGAVHTLAYARAIEEGRYEVAQWIDVFVTRGDTYALTHAAPQNLYAVPQEQEKVNGVIQGGRDGQFAVDIPLFSHRGFMHQAVMEGVRLGVRAQTWPADGDFQTAQLAVGPGFPAMPLEVWALYRGAMWPMRVRDGRLVADPAGRKSLEEFFPKQPMGMHAMMFDGGHQPLKDETFRSLAPLLVAWGMGGTNLLHHVVTAGTADADRIRVFVLTAGPETFRLRGASHGTETAAVVYDVEVPRP